MSVRVLIVDDDPVMRGLLRDIVKKEGHTPVEAEDGGQAIDIFLANSDIALVILDVIMPVCDGREVLKEIRSRSDVPVIMLTALGSEHHEVAGLNYGADDYIAKPFSYKVLVARINALLRKQVGRLTEVLTVGNMSIDQAAQGVFVGGVDPGLTLKEYNLLVYLVRNAGRVLTREQLLDTVWGYDFDGDPRTLDTHVKTLRAKLGDCGEWIRTARGTGYMFDPGGAGEAENR